MANTLRGAERLIRSAESWPSNETRSISIFSRSRAESVVRTLTNSRAFSPTLSTSPRSNSRNRSGAHARVRGNPEAVSRELFAAEACSSSSNADITTLPTHRRRSPDGPFVVHARHLVTNGARRLDHARRTLVKNTKGAIAAHPQAELTVKRLASGAFAGVVSRTAVAPLDVAKLKFMLEKPVQGASLSVMGILSRTFREDGVKGLFRGNGLNCCRVAPGKAIELCTFETVRALTGRADIAGGAAGALNTLATYPLEVLRTRVALDPSQGRGGLVKALRRVSRSEGSTALYRGCGFSILGVIPYTAAQYVVYDGLCKGYQMYHEQAGTANKEVPAGLTMLFGSVAAMVASAATFPMEVYRRQLQLSGGTNVVALQALKGMVRTGGVGGLYRGLGASCLKLGPAAGMSFLCYEAAKSALNIGIAVPPPPLEGRDDHPAEAPMHRMETLPHRHSVRSSESTDEVSDCSNSATSTLCVA